MQIKQSVFPYHRQKTICILPLMKDNNMYSCSHGQKMIYIPPFMYRKQPVSPPLMDRKQSVFFPSKKENNLQPCFNGQKTICVPLLMDRKQPVILPS